jgi:hypothetical protein
MRPRDRGGAVGLTREELDAGIAYWYGTSWPRDFHNAYYQSMATANPDGHFTELWWSRFVHELTAWIATRPKSIECLTQRARERFTALSEAWDSGVRPNLDRDIESVEWSQVAPFTRLVAEIKNVTSPVFTAKFCHLLAPAIFPLVDNTAMGSPFLTYEACFTAYKREWQATGHAARGALTSRLAEEVGESLTSSYPTKNKVVELCLIGRCHTL